MGFGRVSPALSGLFNLINQKKMLENPDLREERANATFAMDALAAVIWENDERVRRRRKIAEFVDAQPALRLPRPLALMTREERMENVQRVMVAAIKLAPKIIDLTNPEESYYYTTTVQGIDGGPFLLHYGMGIPTLTNNADEQQAAEWIPRMQRHEIDMVYAQTELGHGTSLNNLETTATFDASADEFVLNTPTITATKFWPGNLGKMATHAIVVAQLRVASDNYGPHLFIVPLRDLDSHKLLPGVIAGDIGSKFGINTNDNGFLRLSNMRIPRRNMLMRHAKLNEKGVYFEPVHAKANYTGMMHVRSMMIISMAIYLSSAVTIAIRYSCIRRQGEIILGRGEVKVLDYQTQQHRLFPQLARSFAFFFAGIHIRQLYFKVMCDLNSGNADVMSDLHGLGSGLKAQVAYQVALGIEQCRMACGGHGYSNASGIPMIYTTAVGGCTYEGENMVMLLQCGRHLLKHARGIRATSLAEREVASAITGPHAKYLYEPFSEKPSGPAACWQDFRTFLHAFQRLSRRLTLDAYDRLNALASDGITHVLAWNETGVDWCRAARAHTRAFLARIFIESVAKVQDQTVRPVLMELLTVYLTYELLECAEGLLEEGWLTRNDMHAVRMNYYASLKRLRPQAVPIVDAFGYTDRELDSVLGRWDGQVYENLLKFAQQSPLNDTEVPEFHLKHVHALMTESRQKSKI